jgi:putative restriction endonuclease
MEDSESHKIRIAAFDWLQNLMPIYDYVLSWKQLTKEFYFQNTLIPLIGAKGIWKPKALQRFPISITSVAESEYDDKFIDNETLFYSYRGTNPNHSDNVGLRNAMNEQIPLIYFHQIMKGIYHVTWPIFIVGDEPNKLRFTASAESREIVQNEILLKDPAGDYRRKYQTRQVLIRLHQKSFRERVLHAYQDHCAICNLQHRTLLDAAHIIPDHEGGTPEVTNGLSLCKIHHAAYDQNILGIDPDYRIEIREDILSEIDGPMLKYGLQKMNGSKLILPRSLRNRPDKAGLDFRYQKFKSAS